MAKLPAAWINDSSAGGSGSFLLLETDDYLLLETGDKLVLNIAMVGTQYTEIDKPSSAWATPAKNSAAWSAS